MGINRDSIPTQGEVRDRWENMGSTRDSISTWSRGKGEVGEYGK